MSYAETAPPHRRPTILSRPCNDGNVRSACLLTVAPAPVMAGNGGGVIIIINMSSMADM